MLFVQSSSLAIELDPSVDPSDFVNNNRINRETKAKKPESKVPDAPSDFSGMDVVGESDPAFQKALRDWELAVVQWERDCIQVRIDHKIELEELQAELVRLDKLVEEKQDDLKETKDERKACLQSLIYGEKNGPEYSEKPKRPTFEKTTNKAGETVVKIFTPADEPDDESWREIPIETVIPATMEGLGKKKREAILDAFENLGELIDAKIEAGKKFKHFSEVLPNGVGKALADRIEDAIEEVLARHLK